jgi:hypothetical protein
MKTVHFLSKRTLSLVAVSVVVLFAGALVMTPFFSHEKEMPPEARLSSTIQGPESRAAVSGWEDSFFSALEERTERIGLSNLKTSVIGAEEVELRFWYDARPDTINGFVIRRSGDVWSARGIRQSRNSWPSPLIQEAFGVPKSGWNAFWKQLTDAGILTLPDSIEINCTSGALDGGAYVVEVLTKQGYRTYRYDNPQLGGCTEAKTLVSIERILADELTITPSQ